VRIAYILIGVLAYSLMGCHNSENSPSQDHWDLTDTHLQQLGNINAAQSDTLQAISTAFPASSSDQKSVNPAIDNKAQQMAKLIQQGNCAPQGAQYDGWLGQWQVSGATCPLTYNQHSEMTNTNLWSTSLQLNFTNPTLQGLSGLDKIVVQGQLSNLTQINGKRVVTGSFHYQPFNLTGLGTVQADIALVPVTEIDSTLTMDISAPDLNATVQVRTKGDQTFYTLNGKTIDQKTLLNLFSSFQLLEIMDHASKLR